MRAFAKLTTVVDGERRIVSDPPLIVPIEEVAAGADAHRDRGVRARRHPRVPADADARPARAARALPLRPRGAQGRRRRQRRHARLDRAHARPRRQRSAVPAAQGGGGIGARAVPGQEHVRPARPAGGRGPAPHAGRQRHHARLDPHQGHGRGEPRLLHAPTLGRQGLGDHRVDGPARDDPLRAAVRPALAKAHARSGDAIAIGELPRRAATASTARWLRSPRRTPTRTSATTTPWPPRPTPAE